MSPTKATRLHQVIKLPQKAKTLHLGSQLSLHLKAKQRKVRIQERKAKRETKIRPKLTDLVVISGTLQNFPS